MNIINFVNTERIELFPKYLLIIKPVRFKRE